MPPRRHAAVASGHMTKSDKNYCFRRSLHEGHRPPVSLPIFDRARIDHIIHFSLSSEETWAQYEKLGFALGPETSFSEAAKDVHSRLLNFGHTRVELMAMRPGGDPTSFQPAQAFIALRKSGLFGLAITTPDDDNGSTRAQRSGVVAAGQMSFDSKNTEGEGSSYTLSFYYDPNVALSFVQAAPFEPAPAAQHPNGVTRVHGLTYVAEDPSKTRGTAAFIGGADVRERDGALYWNDRAGLECACLSPEAFNAAYGGLLGDDRWPSAYMALITCMTADLEGLQARLEEAGIAYKKLDRDRIVIDREAGCGAMIEFVSEAPVR